MRPDETLAAKLQKALDHAGNTHTLDDVADAIEEGKAQIWREGGTVLVTEIRDTPQKRTLNAWLAAGEMEAVIDLLHEAAEWGKYKGCDRVTVRGRKGWERVGKEYGLRRLNTTFEVAI